MRLVKYNPFDPFKTLDVLQDEMNRLFDSSLGKDMYRGSFAPAIDIWEDDANIYIEADLPGLEQKDIKVNLKNDTLTLSGEKQGKKEEKKKNYFRSERVQAKFYRQMVLPVSVDGSKVKAHYKDGVLKITLPKKEEAKEKEIAIDVE